MKFDLRDSISSTKPLPLKQRTSSRDGRRDFSQKTWVSLLRLIKPREFFITVDNFSIWRRHLAWAMEDGSELRGYISQRYASSMVFMSLLLGAALNVLFNSDFVTTDMRKNMREDNYMTISFWAGIIMLLSVVLTILSIISTFTAWGMITAVSDANAQCILRSSIGQYVAELPGRFIVAAIYSFLLWVILFCFLLLPVGVLSFIVVFISLGLFLHVVVVFSAFGRIIMHTGAMGTHRIFEEDYERGLLPHGLHANLLSKATVQLESKTSIMRQYRFPQKPLSTSLSMESLASLQMSDKSLAPDPPRMTRMRKTSSVRFADNLLSSSTQVTVESPLSQTKSPAAPMDERRGSGVLKPPRPPPVKVPCILSESNSYASPYSGDSSVVSVEEWLKGSPMESKGHGSDTSERKSQSQNATEADKVTNGVDAGKSPPLNLSSNRPQRGLTRGISSSGRAADNSRNTQQSLRGFPDCSPDVAGQKSLKPKSGGAFAITNDEQTGTAEQTQEPELPPAEKPVHPPSNVNTFRSNSAVSSTGGGAPDIGISLSDDHKFYEEYGDLFDPESGRTRGGPHSSKQQEKRPLLSSNFQHSSYEAASRENNG